MSYRSRITIEPGKRGGRTCVRDLRIAVYDVLGWLASGMSEDDILRDHPDLGRDDIRACLEFAVESGQKAVTDAGREEQRRSFAYGNTAIENPRITRALIDRVAETLDRDSSRDG